MTGPSDIAHWRTQIFQRLLLVVLVLGSATAVPSALLAASDGMWLVVAVDTVAIGLLVTVWRFPGLRFDVRVGGLLGVAFAVGVALLIQERPVSYLYLAAAPILAALLLGLRAARWWLLASSSFVLAISALPTADFSTLAGVLPGLVRPLIITVNFMFLAGVITFSCGVLLQHLTESLAAMQATADAMQQQRNALQALNHEQRLSSAALAALNDMVMIAEVAEGQPPRIIFVNDAFERRTGHARAAVLGKGLNLLAGPDTSRVTLARIDEALRHGAPVSAELLNYPRAGEPYWVETELVPFADEGGRNTHWVVVERDITERRKSENDIHQLAFYDVLTGLPNRRLLADRVDKLLETSLRDGSVGALLCIDLDNFKDINDARGHAVGDALLRTVAARLASHIRRGDTVARIGGDEFVVLLPRIGADAVEAAHHTLSVAEQVRLALADTFVIEQQSYQTSASIGATLFPGSGASAHDLLREADTAMYRAKRDGRNGIVFFEEAMQADVERRLTLARGLAQALGKGELEMHYQPQIGRDGSIAGAELLMRWRGADGVMVAPDVFIPIAEQTGQILRLGQWALREACQAVVRLRAAGHQLPLSVNVSPSQFRQPDFVDHVRHTLASSGAPATSLILEVTEGLLIDKFDETVERMHQLAALGIRFSIDDFGTGYSSLAYLRRMPLYELKIDRSFVHAAQQDASGLAIVQAILAMAHHLDLRVVAEGVETRDQADFLAANGCEAMQGFLFARAAPFSQLLAVLA